MLRTVIAMALSVWLLACISHDAPGTKPAEMSAAEHLAECRRHESLAEAYDQRARELRGGKGTYTAQYTADHERRVAKQHGDAARTVDPSMNACPS